MTRPAVRRHAALPALVSALVLVLAGCSSSGGNGSGSGGSASASGGLSGKITVFAAASLTESFTTLGKQFESAHAGTSVSFKFDASSTLATQITQGNSADVFASAATANMDTVTKAGDAKNPVNFVSNTMEIATPAGNPAHITSVNDLAKSSVKVALCDTPVPCGATAQQVFKNAHITVHPVSTEPDVKSTLAKVELNEVDAGMVYVTDVKAAGTKVTGVKIPSSVNATTTYPIAVLTHSGNPTLAQAWVDYVRSPAAQKVLKQAGFSAP
jgi:molybdate transport system substrate-binding protein